ncbi:MAG: methylated-DNA--[protein]-cysteine S-methyltransferase [bacterium]
MKPVFYSYVESPIGPLLLSGTEQHLKGLYFSTGSKARGPDPQWRQADTVFVAARTQLDEYFAGERKVFDLDLAPEGTPFKRRVLAALQDIPFGETRSYGEIAVAIGNPKSVRAVGSANGNNPIALIIPCHRVIGSNGSLTGFGGGLETKRFLLEFETQHSGLWA